MKRTRLSPNQRRAPERDDARRAKVLDDAAPKPSKVLRGTSATWHFNLTPAAPAPSADELLRNMLAQPDGNQANREYQARQSLRKAATDYGAAVLVGVAEVTAEAFRKLTVAASDGYFHSDVVSRDTKVKALEKEVADAWAQLDHRVDGQPFWTDHEVPIEEALRQVLVHYRNRIAELEARVTKKG